MTSQEILTKFIKFYEARGHKLIPNVSLVPENDPTLLFVNSGMFPLVPYLSGQSHPMGKRLVNIQRSLRLQDIEEVGDVRHTCVFHMMGNWSLGDYFKKEQLSWVYEFLIDQLGLDITKMYATVFAGDSTSPKDEESIAILKDTFAKYGIKAKEGERIFPCGRKSNWWQRGDAVGELGGPDSEIYYYLGDSTPKLGTSPEDDENNFLEIGNSVFMQYIKTGDGWSQLSQKNVDFGGGLERIALAVQNKKDIYETDNFFPIIQKMGDISQEKYGSSEKVTKSMRIVADHVRAAVLLAMDGVSPGSKEQDYVSRRLLRRMLLASRNLGIVGGVSENLVPIVCQMFSWLYPELSNKVGDILSIFVREEKDFERVIQEGTKYLSKERHKTKVMEAIRDPKNSRGKLASIAFELYQSLGYPFDLFKQYLSENGYSDPGLETVFLSRFFDHQEQSREGAGGKFKGGLADQSDQVVKYHTATHLLHQALREVLGDQVAQQGSNITGERLRFDFSYPQKLTDEEIAKVETKVNEIVAKKLPVQFEILNKAEAEKTGALHFFGDKYGDQVKVYFVGENLENAYSKEFCGGPHVQNTGELAPITIYKQESIGKGKMRIYAKFVS
ncbi:MAG: hypothetical protein ACD_22C00072G0003 [uncultured bacterium]|nr:MAG: hypothetical protein ACD_22C00072G0003 [uncultured bacterium]